jgi:glucose-6-phosphate isomerase
MPEKPMIAESKRKLFDPDKAFLEKNRINLDISYIVSPAGSRPFISEDELDEIAPAVVEKHRMIKESRGDCRDGNLPMTGWQSLPDEITIEHLDEITAAADELSGEIDAFISLGIGGSYLGIEATFKALSHSFYNQLSRDIRGGRAQIYFLGQNTDPDFFHDTLDVIRDKRIGLNVISKSGTTAETAIAFRILRGILEGQPGEKASRYIIVTTDATRGALRELASRQGYRSFVVPDNVGGRYSVLSDVGLFGLAVAGVNIYEFAAGFRHMKERTDTDDFRINPALVHAAVRHLAYRKGKRIEIVATNSAAIYQVTRWMEQLFPESEGHRGYGMWVSPSMYSEKLHASGQMVQDGERNLLETFLKLLEPEHDVEIPGDPENLDGLNYLSDSRRTMNHINQMVIDGPAYAHFMGGVPNMTFEIPRRNAFNLGQLYFLMERSVAVSGYLAGHNPFIQPGVEAYKKAMFALLGKPGAGEEGAKIKAAVEQTNRAII